jgi:hypothetical protein
MHIKYVIRKIVKIPGRLLKQINAAAEYLYFLTLYRKPSPPQGGSRRQLLECGGENLKAAAENFYRFFPQQSHKKIKEADLICAHVFDLLGSGPMKPAVPENPRKPLPQGYEPIDWHTDFKSGYRWHEATFFRFIRMGKKPGADIKVPWELSRFQHLVVLGQAFALTGNRKYADEFQNQITDWIAHNNAGFGVNWSCTMDVAIRAANWLVAMEYFTENAVLPTDFLNNFYTSIYEHGVFIYGHLEQGPPKTNHYLADIAGLFLIALYCPFLKESLTWQQFCVRELEKEILHQVYEDGCSFEGSTAYHRLALELFFYSAFFARRAGIPFSSSYQQRLRKMFEFALYCIKPDGMIPQIGDNDNGRFLIFSERHVLDHRYLLSLAAIYFENADFKLKSFHYDEEAFWVFGMEGHKTWEQLAYRGQELGSKAFTDAGWYIMRRRDNYCFISCGPNGQDGYGGHAHNDKLSFELMLNGRDVIIDPGTCTYTPCPAERNAFRSTASHNTLQIDAIEQNTFSRNLFELQQNSVCSVEQFQEQGSCVRLCGKLTYTDPPVTHCREFLFDTENANMKLHDTITSPAQHTITLNFCLAPDSPQSMICLQGGELAEIEGVYSPEYGKRFTTKRMHYATVMHSGGELTVSIQGEGA